MAKFLKRHRPTQDWSMTGSFMNKPLRGWLHPDEQLAADAGVCYGVRYIGSMEVKQSMRSLNFQERTEVAKASISRVCDAAGLKTASKKSKWPSRVNKLLGDQPNLMYAGSNVNLTITIDCINIIVMETGDMIAYHEMPGISFASGGDTDTVDFVTYVAKDLGGRACHVLECGGGLAQDVIATMGQAFELRFKQYLAKRPPAVNLPDRLEEGPPAGSDGDAWGDEHEYYNDRPGAIAPLPAFSPAFKAAFAPADDQKVDLSKEDAERPALEVKTGNLIDFDCFYDNAQEDAVGGSPGVGPGGTEVTHNNVYENKENTPAHQEAAPPAAAAVTAADGGSTQRDTFDMTPFCVSLPSNADPPTLESPYNERWFHGKISRQQCSRMLQKDGDFLVRESVSTSGQFVLSSRRDDHVKHLLLVDPQGVVRTRDRSFESVTDLVGYHLDNHCPITSNDSQIFLKAAIPHPYNF